MGVWSSGFLGKGIPLFCGAPCLKYTEIHLKIKKKKTAVPVKGRCGGLG
jgi:hypothetical protein